MTCGFRTAAGTDLDALFYSEYANPGALGFRQSDGVDLGNKYTAKSTLGYSVGYRNTAGTDLGYLRGNAFAPIPSTGTSLPSSIWIKHEELYDKARCPYEYEDNEGSTVTGTASVWNHTSTGIVTVSPSCVASGGELHLEIYACYMHQEQGHKHNWRIRVTMNAYPDSEKYGCASPGMMCETPPIRTDNGQIIARTENEIYEGGQLPINVEGPWMPVFNGVVNTSPTVRFAYFLYSNDGSGGKSYSDQLRVYSRFYNVMGPSPWMSNTFFTKP